MVANLVPAPTLTLFLRVVKTRLPLSGKRRGSRPRQRAGELGEDGQVGVKLDPIKATDPQGQ